jgi:peptidylprolyl isomerase
MLTYHPDLQVDITQMLRRPSGLLVQDLAAGTGDTLTPGRQAVVRYSGWLPDGTLIDSNRDADPFVFRVGAGDVIPGWDEGVVGMRAGGTRRLILPARLAYGETGSGPVPPHATLIFVVEVLEIR